MRTGEPKSTTSIEAATLKAIARAGTPCTLTRPNQRGSVPSSDAW